MAAKKALKIMLIAGEASGDILAAEVMAALRKKHKNVKFIGVGGAHMAKQGLSSFFPMEELSLMGIAEVLPHLRHLFKRKDQLVKLAQKEQPDLLLTVDAPDFSLRVAKAIKASTGVLCAHYVSPSIWAWRQGRAAKMAKFLDHVFLLFPFEEKYYTPTGLASTFVGHPVASRLGEYKNTPPNTPRLALVPGSRATELTRLLPNMLAAFDILKKVSPSLQGVLPVANAEMAKLAKSLGANRKGITLLEGDKKYEALAKCHAALATSGTVNLELAMLNLPMVVVYKTSWLTFVLAKVLVNVPYISPVNWVAHKKIVPELLQTQATTENMVEEILPLLTPTKTRETQKKHLLKVKKLLTSQKNAGDIIAQKILSMIK